jgi:hypothetical protein
MLVPGKSGVQDYPQILNHIQNFRVFTMEFYRSYALYLLPIGKWDYGCFVRAVIYLFLRFFYTCGALIENLGA